MAAWATAAPARSTRTSRPTSAMAASSAALSSSRVCTGCMRCFLQSATTTAVATESVWVSDTCQDRIPSASARLAASPEISSRGAPEPPRKTSTSANLTPPRPVPSAFIVASLAEKRAASPGTGSARADSKDRSASVKMRSVAWGRRARSWRKRSMSTASMPSPITCRLGSVHRPRNGRCHRSLDRDDLGEIARPVHVVAARTRDPVRERLEGHYRHGRRQQLGNDGDLQKLVRDRLGLLVALVAHDHDRCATGLDLRDVGHHLFPEAPPSGDGDDYGAFVDERDRAVLHLPGRIGLCPDVGELFQFERTLERDGVPHTPPQEVVVPPLGTLVCHREVVVHPGDGTPDEPRKSEEPAGEVPPLFRLDRSALACKVEGEKLEHHYLGRVALGGRHPDLRACSRVEGAGCLARQQPVADVGQRDGLGTAAPCLAQRVEGVDGLPRLADGYDESMFAQDRVPVTELAGDLDF